MVNKLLTFRSSFKCTSLYPTFSGNEGLFQENISKPKRHRRQSVEVTFYGHVMAVFFKNSGYQTMASINIYERCKAFPRLRMISQALHQKIHFNYAPSK